MGQDPKQSEDDSMTNEEMQRAIFKGKLLIIGLVAVLIALLVKAVFL